MFVIRFTSDGSHINRGATYPWSTPLKTSGKGDERDRLALVSRNTPQREILTPPSYWGLVGKGFLIIIISASKAVSENLLLWFGPFLFKTLSHVIVMAFVSWYKKRKV